MDEHTPSSMKKGRPSPSSVSTAHVYMPWRPFEPGTDLPFEGLWPLTILYVELLLASSIPDMLCRRASVEMKIHWIGRPMATIPLARLSAGGQSPKTPYGARLPAIKLHQPPCARHVLSLATSIFMRDRQLTSMPGLRTRAFAILRNQEPSLAVSAFHLPLGLRPLVRLEVARLLPSVSPKKEKKKRKSRSCSLPSGSKKRRVVMYFSRR